MRTSHFVAIVLLGAAVLIPFPGTIIAQRPDEQPNQNRKPHHPAVPSWFKDLDADGAGQVTLRQWRDAGGLIDEFRKLDRNGDGILTTEELLHYLKRPVALKLEAIWKAVFP